MFKHAVSKLLIELQRCQVSAIQLHWHHDSGPNQYRKLLNEKMWRVTTLEGQWIRYNSGHIGSLNDYEATNRQTWKSEVRRHCFEASTARCLCRMAYQTRCQLHLQLIVAKRLVRKLYLCLRDNPVTMIAVCMHTVRVFGMAALINMQFYADETSSRPGNEGAIVARHIFGVRVKSTPSHVVVFIRISPRFGSIGNKKNWNSCHSWGPDTHFNKCAFTWTYKVSLRGYRDTSTQTRDNLLKGSRAKRKCTSSKQFCLSKAPSYTLWMASGLPLKFSKSTVVSSNPRGNFEGLPSLCSRNPCYLLWWSSSKTPRWRDPMSFSLSWWFFRGPWGYHPTSRWFGPRWRVLLCPASVRKCANGVSLVFPSWIFFRFFFKSCLLYVFTHFCVDICSHSGRKCFKFWTFALTSHRLSSTVP